MKWELAEIMTDYDLDSKLVPGTKAAEVLK
jgi:hypothetical protein